MSNTTAVWITSGNELLECVVSRPACRVLGRGWPTAILVHGLANDRDESGQFPVLSGRLVDDGLCVVCIDLRGDRRSHEPGRQLPATQWTQDVLAVLAWARWQTEIDADRLFLVGASMGGAVGVSVAALDRDLRGVVTLGSPADGLRWLKVLWCRERGDSAWSAFMKSVEDDRVARATGKAPKFVALVGDFLPVDGPGRAAAEKMLQENPGMLDVIALEVADDLRLITPETSARDLSTPALFVHGTEDALVSPNEAMRMAVAGTTVRRVIVTGGEHQLLLGSHQDEVVNLVSSWLRELVD